MAGARVRVSGKGGRGELCEKCEDEECRVKSANEMRNGCEIIEVRNNYKCKVRTKSE